MSSSPQAGGVRVKAPFRLASGSTSEGRPDLIHLIQAREPHERLVREGALERRNFAEERRDAAKARLKERGASSPHSQRALNSLGMGDDSPDGGKYGLGMLGLVPAGMVASGTRNELAAIGAFPSLGALGQPAKRAAPPALVGVLRHRERSLEPRRPDIQAYRQHELGRIDRSQNMSSNTARDMVAVVADAEASARGEASLIMGSKSFAASGVGPLGSTASANGFAVAASSSNHIFVPPLPLASGAGSSADEAILVRVGVPVSELLDGALEEGKRVATAVSTARWNKMAPSLAALKTNMAESISSSILIDERSNYYLDPMNKIAFDKAVSDLPEPARKAVNQLISEGKRLTVADIHQRRPPVLERGREDSLTSQIGDNWRISLREAFGEDKLRKKTLPWKGGCVAPTSKSETTPASLDTFDSIARTHATAYYVSDFSKPSPPTMRPSSRGVTRFAVNIPSMVTRHAGRDDALLTARLL
jgi:hypothetical protein